MSGWNFDEVGGFDSAKDAHDWAERNNVDPRDLHLKNEGKGVRASMRRSGQPADRFKDRDNSRKDGFY